MIHALSHRSHAAATVDSTGAGKPCGHARHVGTCPHCQRAQLARWRAQLNGSHSVVSR